MSSILSPAEPKALKGSWHWDQPTITLGYIKGVVSKEYKAWNSLISMNIYLGETMRCVQGGRQPRGYCPSLTVPPL